MISYPLKFVQVEVESLEKQPILPPGSYYIRIARDLGVAIEITEEEVVTISTFHVDYLTERLFLCNLIKDTMENIHKDTLSITAFGEGS